VSPNAVVELTAPGGTTVRIGNRERLSVLAGPCQMQSRAHALEIAEILAGIARRLEIGLVYKSSFDKANRTSARGARGIGLHDAFYLTLGMQAGCPVVTADPRLMELLRNTPFARHVVWIGDLT